MTCTHAPAHDPEIARLTKCVQSLPMDVRRTYTLRKVYDLSYPEIVARLNLTVAEVENLLVQAVLTSQESSDAKDGTAS
ncbi:MAG TPA: sigma-70 region 4 domain-containing protein [Steroidobacteraceae bacterium]